MRITLGNAKLDVTNRHGEVVIQQIPELNQRPIVLAKSETNLLIAILREVSKG